MFPNNDTEHAYLERFISSCQIIEERQCGVWLDDGTSIAELKKANKNSSKVEDATNEEIEAAVTDKTKAMAFILQSSRKYDGLRRYLHNNMVMGNNEYPTTVTDAFNMLLEWDPDPSSIAGRAVERDTRHVSFATVRKGAEGT